MKPVLFILFFVVAFAQAQLVPPGMVLPSAEADSAATADSVAPTPVVEQPAPANMVEVPEGQSKNWDGYEPANPDSLRYYEVEVFRSSQESTRMHSIANVLKVVALGTGFVGLGLYGGGYLTDDSDKRNTMQYVGGGFLVGSLVSMGFAFGFDLSADGLRIESEYYNQKLIDYKKRHSALIQDNP